MDMIVNARTRDSEKVIICPKCDGIFNGVYLLDMKCPRCNTQLSESNFVNWVNKQEDYDIAKTIVEQKKLSKGEDD